MTVLNKQESMKAMNDQPYPGRVVLLKEREGSLWNYFGFGPGLSDGHFWNFNIQYAQFQSYNLKY